MNIAICDDEPNIREQMRELLLAFDEKEAVSLFADGRELLAADVSAFDVIFLDIGMKETDGLAAAREIRARQKKSETDIWGSFPLLVFVTGYREHMPEAFAVHAFGYVLKPIEREAFEKLYREALTEVQTRDRERRSCGRREIRVKSGEKIRMIAAEEILYVESEGRKNVIHTVKGEAISYYGALRAVEDELPEFFFRIHKGYLVNMNHIVEYNRGQMKLSDGSGLLISKYRYADFVSAYLDFLR